MEANGYSIVNGKLFKVFHCFDAFCHTHARAWAFPYRFR